MLVLKYSKPQDGTLELQSFSGKPIVNFLQGIWKKKKDKKKRKKKRGGETYTLVECVNLCRNNESKYQA